MQILNDEHLLMIEPTGPATTPVDDVITQMARRVWAKTKPMAGAYKGTHQCCCGERSDNRDHYAAGRVTNSLMVHYVSQHRDEVPRLELAKLAIIDRELRNVHVVDFMKGS